MALKQDGVHFFLCPKQGNEIEVVVQNRVWVSNPKWLTYIQIFGTSGSHYIYCSLNKDVKCSYSSVINLGMKDN